MDSTLTNTKPQRTVTPLDVAAYILELSETIGEPITNMKLQKLIYYAYAWFAVEKGKKLFEEPIMAWKYGPVVTSVYDAYKGYGADIIKKSGLGDAKNLDEFSRSLVEDIFNIYGNKTAIELMSLTHSEAPWRDAFDSDSTPKEIDFEAIRAYYKAKKSSNQ